MRRWWIVLALVASVLVLVAAGCGGDDEAAAPAEPAPAEPAPAEPAPAEPAPAEPAPAESTPAETAPAAEENQYGASYADGDFGETYNPDPALVEQALGGLASLPDDAAVKNIMLAGIARAGMPVDQDLALKCWQDNKCETGTGGDKIACLADGFGGNVARQLFKMEFILQALTYPDIGEIIYTDANLDTQKAISDVRAMIAQGCTVIVSYPDAADALLPAYRAATEKGIQVALWANAGIGTPGTDYLTFSGTDQCAIGKAYAAAMNEALPEGGEIALLGGTPGNTQSPQWQKCEKEALNPNVKVVAEADTSWTRQGTFEAVSQILAAHPNIKGYSYDYGDAFVGAIRAYEAANKPLDIIATVHSDDNPFLCAWKEAGNPNFDARHFVAFFTQGRIALTAGMMENAGAEVPPELIVGAGLKKVDESSCRSDIPADGSPSALIPAELQSQMYPPA